MKIVKTRTAQGGGKWGHVTYLLELVTTSTTWVSVDLRTTRSTSSYELVFPPTLGNRYFSSDADRQRFIEESFVDVHLDLIEPPDMWDEAHPLAALLGQSLTVRAVRDSAIRVRSGDYEFSIWAPTAVVDAYERVEETSSGFELSLRGVSGKRLTGVDELLDRGLVLTFEGDIDIEICLSRPGVRGEANLAAELINEKDWKRGASWWVGREPFESAVG